MCLLNVIDMFLSDNDSGKKIKIPSDKDYQKPGKVKKSARSTTEVNEEKKSGEQEVSLKGMIVEFSERTTLHGIQPIAKKSFSIPRRYV